MQIDQSKLPKHVAIVMDGNGRWAKKRGLPKIFGHRQGAKTVDRIVTACRRLGIKALTLYTFSTENWKRPKSEIDSLMDLLYDYLEKKYEKLNKNNIRLNAIGRLNQLPPKVRERLFDVSQKTSKNDGMVLTLALNYGARSEIVDACRKISRDVKQNILNPDDISEERFSDYLYTTDLPDPDLLIRTSGEYRVSNFLLWQISYTEIYITDKLWPDFGKKDLEQAILEYKKRIRKYGG